MDIVLGNYKGIKANIPYIAYTEEDVNSQIATLLSGNPVREQKTGPLAMGDTAVIDYEGFKDGVELDWVFWCGAMVKVDQCVHCQ